MHEDRASRAIASLLIALLCASCVTTRLPPISDAGAAFEPLRDERALWQASREEEKKLLANAAIYHDPLLVSYLEEIVGRLNTPGMAANPELSYRVTVIEDPTLNAFAYPHGSLFVHTGLLARMQNEDQLATVLGHEMTHVEGRHMLRYQRSARNKQIGFGIAAITAAVVIAHEQGEQWGDRHYGRAATIGVLGSVLVNLGLTLAVLASVNGYGRELETEADLGAFDKMTRAGYDTGQAPGVYRALLAEHGDSGKMEAFFFGNHPKLTNRIENAEAWLADHPVAAGSGRSPADPERFEKRIRPVVRDDAALNIELERFELAEDELHRVLDTDPSDPRAHALFGTLRAAQARAAQDPAERAELEGHARDAYREAIRLDPNLPEPHRELGLYAYEADDRATACVQFRQYVELAPDAEDAGRIRDYLRELEADGRCPE